mmetsp:Transcript_52604/g.105594  ORF Transcript_52604/g.105594 Transcript_52604/m.105594 type:complete len:224 (-) Transcript_52604:1237-1908(-)
MQIWHSPTWKAFPSPSGRARVACFLAVDDTVGLLGLPVLADPHLRYPPVQFLVTVHLHQQPNRDVKNVDVCPQGALLIDVVRNARIMAVFDCQPLLGGALLQGIWNSRYHDHTVLKSSHHNSKAEDALVKQRAPVLMVFVNKEVYVLVHIVPDVLELRHVEHPPQLMRQGARAETTEVEDAAIHHAVLVAPEVRIVHVEVLVPQRDVVGVGMLEEVHLRGVGV